MDVLQGRRWAIWNCEALEGLRRLPDSCVQCVVTSPPYYGLRDYGTGKWEGGDPACDHRSPTMRECRNEDRPMLQGSAATNSAQLLLASRSACGKCGAVKVDRQIGLEPSPVEYIARLVEVFREVKRVLRDDGTMWVNIGDSWANDGKWGGHTGGKHRRSLHASPIGMNKRYTGLKPKDMIGIPWMLAFALRDDGWFLRQECIWAKRNPMTESVNDRPTRAHEQVFLLAKSKRYFYDKFAASEKSVKGASGSFFTKGKTGTNGNGRQSQKPREDNDLRNMRSVWSMSSEPCKAAHFAVMPSELARRCVAAGVSEKGCCPTCRRPWVRIVEKTRVATRPGNDSKINRASAHGESPYEGHGGIVVGNRDPLRHCTKTVTVGWKSNCECEAGEPVPCLVLDPFAGAGTVPMVGLQLGAQGLGLELKAEYADIARQRIVDDNPLENRVAE